MRVMLTRPRADSDRLAGSLRARGHDVVIEPVLAIAPTGEAPPLDGVAALVATSANGIRAFAAAAPRRDLPVYAVGDATARAAREEGFAAVESARGDAAAVAALIAGRVRPEAGALLHVHGRDVTGNLGDSLKSAGYSVRSAVMYEAVAAGELSEEGRKYIAGGEIDVILFYSPRTAGTFVRLVREARLEDGCETMTAICLSPAVAEAGSALIWGDVRIAATPDGAAMLQQFDAVQESRQS